VRNFESEEAIPVVVSPWKKLKFFMKVERYMFARVFGKAKLEYRNLPSEDTSGKTGKGNHLVPEH